MKYLRGLTVELDYEELQELFFRARGSDPDHAFRNTNLSVEFDVFHNDIYLFYGDIKPLDELAVTNIECGNILWVSDRVILGYMRAKGLLDADNVIISVSW